MTPKTSWTLIRWLISIALAIVALLVVNYAFYSAWQTVAPPGNKTPEAWKYEAVKSFWLFISLLSVTVLTAINLRPGWPHLRSKWTMLFLAVAVLGVVYPRAHHFLEVDRCLDSGGRWHYMRQICQK